MYRHNALFGNQVGINYYTLFKNNYAAELNFPLQAIRTIIMSQGLQAVIIWHRTVCGLISGLAVTVESL